MAAVASNPYIYRTKSGRFTKRKTKRRSWVPTPGKRRRASRGKRKLGSFARTAARDARGRLLPRGRKRRSAGKRRRAPARRTAARRKTRARRRPWWYGSRGPGGHSRRRKPKWIVSSRRKARWSKGGRRKGILTSYGPQLPRGARVAVSRSGQLSLFTNNPRSKTMARRRRRKNPSHATTVNPRKRRRGRARRRRGYRRVGRLYTKNPRNVVAMAKNAIMPSAFGVGAGFLAGFIDTKLLAKKRLFQGLAKFGLSVAGAYALRNKPLAAAAWAGSLMGTIGYGYGVKLGGGQVANTAGEVLAGLADMAAEDDGLASLLSDAGGNIADLVTAGELADGEVEIADADDVADLVME